MVEINTQYKPNRYDSKSQEKYIFGKVSACAKAVDPTLETYQSHGTQDHNELSSEHVYLVYATSQERLDAHTEGVYCDIELYTRGNSYAILYDISDELRNTLDMLRDLTDSDFVKATYNRVQKVDTGDTNVLRLNVQLYFKFERRFS